MAQDPQNSLLTIAEMCAEFDVTARTLRFYESKDLITPKRVGTKRLYTSREKARLTLILLGKKFGFSLDEIGKLLSLYTQDEFQLEQLQETMRLGVEKRDAISAQIATLRTVLNDLDDQIAFVADLIAERETLRNRAQNAA